MRPSQSSILGPRLVFGLGIIAIGVIFLLGNLEIADTHQYLKYWPAILVVLGIAYFFQCSTTGGRIWGAILTFVGAAMLLDRIGYWDFNLWSLWPLVLIVAGASMITQSSRRRQAVAAGAEDSESFLKGFALMSGFRRTVSTKEFTGGELTAVMGGAEIDLRQATMKGDEAVVDVFAFWGGIEIKVPEDWTVIVKALPFMGGVDDKTAHPSASPQKRLIITGTAIMGGVEIRN
jgi:predicted membrane protein